MGASPNRPLAGLTLAALLLAGCTGESAPAPPGGSPGAGPGSAPATGPGSGPSGAPTGGPTVLGVVATGLRSPWGLAFLPDGGALVSERDTGAIRRVGPDGTLTTVGTVPDVAAGGEGGLLGIALPPGFPDPPYLYAYLTARTGGGGRVNRLVRLRYDGGGALGPAQTLLDGVPAAGLHDGGRIAFGPDGMLYVATGDATRAELAQDPASPAGKILRLTPDGGVPPGNPFPGSPVWSLGHRNVQGLAWDSAGRLWASEFGTSRYDEVNLIRPGGNYGWPEVEGPGGGGRFVEPVVVWRPAEASPSGVAVVGDALYVAALRGQRLWRVPLPPAGGTVPAGPPQPLLAGTYGRLRTVAAAPDGTLWVVTSNTDGRGAPRAGDDRILRLRP